MTTSRFTPDDHVYDPSCPLPAGDGHGYKRAHQRGCRCPGESLDVFRQFKRDEWTRRRDRDYGGHIPVGSDWSHEMRFPAMPGPVHEAAAIERDFYQRDDLMCQTEDPELFHPVGTGRLATLQEKAALAVCGRCPAATMCLQVALTRRSVDGVQGGATGPQRRRMLEGSGVQVMAA